MDQLLLIFALCLAGIGLLCLFTSLFMTLRSHSKNHAAYDSSFTDYELINDANTTQHSQAHINATTTAGAELSSRRTPPPAPDKKSDLANAGDIDTLIADHPDNSELHLIRLENLYHSKDIEQFNHYLPELIKLSDQVAIDQALHWQQQLMTNPRRSVTQSISAIALDKTVTANPVVDINAEANTLQNDTLPTTTPVDDEILFASLEQEILGVSGPQMASITSTDAKVSEETPLSDTVSVNETVTIEASIEQIESLDLPEETLDTPFDIGSDSAEAMPNIMDDSETPLETNEANDLSQHSIQFKIPTMTETVHNISFSEKLPSHTLAFNLVDFELNESPESNKPAAINSSVHNANEIAFERMDVASSSEALEHNAVPEEMVDTESSTIDLNQPSQFSTTFNALNLDSEIDSDSLGGIKTYDNLISATDTTLAIEHPMIDEFSPHSNNTVELSSTNLTTSVTQRLNTLNAPVVTITHTQPIPNFESSLSATTGSFDTRAVDDLLKEFDEPSETDQNQTNLKLAQQYINLGSTEQAKNFINDILNSAGDDDIKSQARTLLDSLHG